MPKKYHDKKLSVKPLSSPPATLSGIGATAHHRGKSNPKIPCSVNELIAHFRETQVRDENRPTDIPKTIHPALRSILDVPDTLPPMRRPGQRTGGPLRIRRIPGPPPPNSWLTESIHAPVQVEAGAGEEFSARTIVQSSNLPGGYFPHERSLQHAVLKRVAQNWLWHVKYDGFYLSTLPTRLKETLLSYLAIYNIDDGRLEALAPTELTFLFPGLADNTSLTLPEQFADDSAEAVRLDLSGSIRQELPLSTLKRELLKAPLKTPATEVQPESASDTVPDSWDDDFNSGSSAKASHLGNLQQLDMPGALRFASLSHLSFALSPTTKKPHLCASWPTLLGLAPSLSRLTSLSLAYWPLPTLTPNAARTHVTVRNPVSASIPGVSYGGSNVYTQLDGEWSEATNILRRLSRFLYCLTWLDLTGCGDWFEALRVPNGPEWNGSWRGIEHVRLGVGWTPAEPDTDHERMPKATQIAGPAERWDVEEERREYYYRKDVERYKAIAESAKKVVDHLQGVRREGKGKWIEFDLSLELNDALTANPGWKTKMQQLPFGRVIRIASWIE